jgi:thiol-disulfide isomerase/thioredoxin
MRLIFSLALALSFANGFAQGYKIDFNIKGLKDTTIYLGYHFWNQTYITDTARVSNQGKFTFQGSKPLTQGVYFLVLNKSFFLQMVVGEQQRFSMETMVAEPDQNMIVKGDDDNRLFFENSRFERARYKEAEPLVKILRDSTLKEDQKQTAREGFNAISKKVLDFQKDIIEKYPKTVTARILNIYRPVEIPDPPKKANGNIDSTFQLRYYREHYFDHYDLGDGLMLRQAKIVYWDKVKDYLDKLFIQHPDTIKKAIDRLALIAKKNNDTYHYFIWNCLVNYQNHQIMGLDQVYTKVYDTYVVAGALDDWADKTTLQNLKDFADKLKRAPIGSVAPNLMMQNENFQRRDLYNVKTKYTIVYFFSPNCGHCKEETPKLVDFYKTGKTKYGLEVFAVSTDTSMREMRDFIKEMKSQWITVNGPRSYGQKHFKDLYYAETTPTVYILDDKKKIIARKLGVEQIEDFLTNYERIKKAGLAQLSGQ